MKQIIKITAGWFILSLLLQSCYTNKPIASSVSSPDYNKRVNVSGAQYKKKGNAFDVVFNVGLIGAGAVGGYNMNLIQQQTGTGREPIKVANAAIGALAGASIAYLIDQIAGKNKTYPINNYNDWIRKANDNYRFISGSNESFTIINSGVEGGYTVKNLSDVKDFKEAFPNSSYTENVALQVLSSSNLSDIAGLSGIYPQYKEKAKVRYLIVSLSNSSSFALFKEKIDRYPESLSGVNLNINYQNSEEIKSLFAQLENRKADIGDEKLSQYKNEILDNVLIISTTIDSEYEKIQYDKISNTTNPQLLRDYIYKFPNSQYTSTAKTSLNKLDDDNYVKATKGNTKQGFQNYIISFPSGNHIEEANSKISAFNTKEEEERFARENAERERQLEEQRKQEEIKRAEQAQNRALFLQLEGKKVYWYSTCKVKTSSLGGGLLGAIGDAVVGDLNYTSYRLKYTGIVEKIIGEESAKIIVSKIEIEDPSWASVNYLKYRSMVLQSANQGRVDNEVELGGTIIKEYGEINY